MVVQLLIPVIVTLESTTSSKESMMNGEEITSKFTSSMTSLLIEDYFAEIMAEDSFIVIVESSKAVASVILDMILLSVHLTTFVSEAEKNKTLAEGS